MSLDLDPRQRAMLREMGVHVWLPATPLVVADAAALPEKLSNAIESEAAHAIYIRATGHNSLKNLATARVPEVSQALAPAGLPAAMPDAVGVDPAAAPELSSEVPTALPGSVTHQVVTPSRKSAVVSGRATGPTQVTFLPEGIAAMDWPQMADTVAHCQACAMCLGRRAPVLAAPTELTPCDWLVVGDPPDEPQERLGLPFVEEAGVLLDNMLRAVGARRFAPGAASAPEPAQRAYLTHVLKCRPALVRAPAATELATCANYLRREIALTQPKVILAMGRFAMQALLSDTPPESAKLPLGKLRGQVWQFAGVPLVVTYPPSYLMRSGQDKGKAWADLCLALDVVRGQSET